MPPDPRAFWLLFHAGQVASRFSPAKFWSTNSMTAPLPTFQFPSLLTPCSFSLALKNYALKEIPSESIILGENRAKITILFPPSVHIAMSLSNTKLVFDQQNTWKLCTIYWGHSMCHVLCSVIDFREQRHCFSMSDKICSHSSCFAWLC